MPTNRTYIFVNSNGTSSGPLNKNVNRTMYQIKGLTNENLYDALDTYNKQGLIKTLGGGLFVQGTDHRPELLGYFVKLSKDLREDLPLKKGDVLFTFLSPVMNAYIDNTVLSYALGGGQMAENSQLKAKL